MFHSYFNHSVYRVSPLNMFAVGHFFILYVLRFLSGFMFSGKKLSGSSESSHRASPPTNFPVFNILHYCGEYLWQLGWLIFFRLRKFPYIISLLRILIRLGVRDLKKYTKINMYHPLNMIANCYCSLLSHVQLFETPWTVARQASLSFTISWSLLKLMFIELVMPSNHLILYHPVIFLPSVFPSIKVFSNESVL